MLMLLDYMLLCLYPHRTSNMSSATIGSQRDGLCLRGSLPVISVVYFTYSFVGGQINSLLSLSLQHPGLVIPYAKS